MDDSEIIDRIGTLVEREHRLEQEHGVRPLSETEREELSGLEVQLDQCWDLLRQRQAKREFGQNPDDAKVRDANTVENYRQ